MKLLACCTEGKNASTEIKCHSLLPLDDIVAMVEHKDCIPEVIIPSQLCTSGEVRNFKEANSQPVAAHINVSECVSQASYSDPSLEICMHKAC